MYLQIKFIPNLYVIHFPLFDTILYNLWQDVQLYTINTLYKELQTLLLCLKWKCFPTESRSKDSIRLKRGFLILFSWVGSLSCHIKGLHRERERSRQTWLKGYFMQLLKICREDVLCAHACCLSWLMLLSLKLLSSPCYIINVHLSIYINVQHRLKSHSVA